MQTETDKPADVLNAKDSIEMLLKLSSDAATHARHAETTQNQMLTLYLTSLAVYFVVRTSNVFQGSPHPGRPQILNLLLMIMAFLSLICFHRSLVAVQERDVAEVYRIAMKMWLRELNPHLQDVLDRVDIATRHRVRQNLIEKLRNVASGVNIPVAMAITTCTLAVVTYL